MKKKNIMPMGVLIIVVIVAGYFLMTSTTVEGWVESWLPEGQSADGISGQWEIDAFINYADGRSESLHDSIEGLWMEREGVQVESITYQLKAQAFRDEHVGTYDSVEVDIGSLDMYAEFLPIAQPNHFMWAWKDYAMVPYANPVLTFYSSGEGDTTTTPVTIVGSFTIPIEVTNSEGWLGYPLSTLPCDTISEMTADWVTGEYMITYFCQGSLQFRGLNSESGDGDWISASLPGEVTHGVEIGGNQVLMDWTTSVTYS